MVFLVILVPITLETSRGNNSVCLYVGHIQGSEGKQYVPARGDWDLLAVEAQGRVAWWEGHQVGL